MPSYFFVKHFKPGFCAWVTEFEHRECVACWKGGVKLAEVERQRDPYVRKLPKIIAHIQNTFLMEGDDTQIEGNPCRGGHETSHRAQRWVAVCLGWWGQEGNLGDCRPLWNVSLHCCCL